MSAPAVEVNGEVTSDLSMAAGEVPAATDVPSTGTPPTLVTIAPSEQNTAGSVDCVPDKNTNDSPCEASTGDVGNKSAIDESPGTTVAEITEVVETAKTIDDPKTTDATEVARTPMDVETTENVESTQKIENALTEAPIVLEVSKDVDIDKVATKTSSSNEVSEVDETSQAVGCSQAMETSQHDDTETAEKHAPCQSIGGHDTTAIEAKAIEETNTGEALCSQLSNSVDKNCSSDEIPAPGASPPEEDAPDPAVIDAYMLPVEEENEEEVGETLEDLAKEMLMEEENASTMSEMNGGAGNVHETLQQLESAIGTTDTVGESEVASADAGTAALQPETATTTLGVDSMATVEPNADDMIDDIVPFVSYDDKKSLFSKDGRWILPKREQFPSVFCALRIKVQLETSNSNDASAPQDPNNLQPEDVEAILRDNIGFGKSLVRWDELRSGAPRTGIREMIVAMNGELPASLQVGSTIQVEKWGLTAAIIDATETCDDIDPERISALARCFKESIDNDTIVFELPQLWIIPDPAFRAKSGSINLYPGSFWMGFMKSWGAVEKAVVYFKTAEKKAPEPMVNLVVKYCDRESLKMCFTFLYDRYLIHPKQENELWPPWCRLATFEEFESKAGATKLLTKSAPKPKPNMSKPIVKSNRIPQMRVPPLAVAPETPATPTPKSMCMTPDTSEHLPNMAPMSKFAPMTPMPKFQTPRSAGSQVPKPGTQAAKAPARVTSLTEDVDRALTPAEAMHGLSGKQLEAFQMVMTRMERLERENQELMQILLQMQTLLQQQQQRNARLTQIAGHNVSGSDQSQAQSAGNTAKLAMEAHVQVAQVQATITQGQQASPASTSTGSEQVAVPQSGLMQSSYPRPSSLRQPPLPQSSGSMPQQPSMRPQLPVPPNLRPTSGEHGEDDRTPTTPAPKAPAIGAEKRKLERSAFGNQTLPRGSVGTATSATPKVGAVPSNSGPANVDTTDHMEDGMDDEEAPWKRQRRRPRRTPRNSNGAGGEGEMEQLTDQGSRGLAAYHNALLGV